MQTRVKMAFEREILVLPLDQILPLKQVRPAMKETAKYKRIAMSIAEVGIIEPLVVARPKAGGSGFMLLDGISAMPRSSISASWQHDASSPMTTRPLLTISV